MNLTPGEPTIDLPAEHVAQVIIVQERNAVGKIKRSTALMRISEVELRKIADTPKYREFLRAMPTYWCPRGDGKIEVWPRPDQAYDVEVMGAGGRPLAGSARKPVEVPTVTEFVTAINRSYDEQQRSAEIPTQRVERFSTSRKDD